MQFAQTDMGRRAVVSALGHSIGHEMLERGQRGKRLLELAAPHPAHTRLGHQAREHMVFAEGLLHPRPSRVACQADDRTITHVCPLQSHLPGHGSAYTCYERGVESGRESQARGEHGGTNGHVAMRRLLGKKQGYAQT